MCTDIAVAFRESHLAVENVESYSLGRLDARCSAVLEEHLLVCPRCREALDSIEVYNYLHYTRDGPFYARITYLQGGGFFAHHWGRRLEGGKHFRTRAGAKTYLQRSFGQAYPEHACTSRCGSATLPPRTRR